MVASTAGIAELAGKARDGDGNAFGELYRLCWPLTYLHVFKSVMDEDDARNIAQEAFTRAFEGIGTLREPGAFPGFLKTIADRLVQARARKRTERPADLPDAPDAAAPDPAAVAERREFDRALLLALEELEPAHRDVLLLRLVDGLKHREIAQRLGIGIDQASGILARGLARLRVRLAPFVREEP